MLTSTHTGLVVDVCDTGNEAYFGAWWDVCLSEESLFLARTRGETTFAVVQHPPSPGLHQGGHEDRLCPLCYWALTPRWGHQCVWFQLGGQRATRAYLFHKADLPSEHGWPKFWTPVFSSIKWRLELYALPTSSLSWLLENIDVELKDVILRDMSDFGGGETWQGNVTVLPSLFFFFHSFFLFFNKYESPIVGSLNVALCQTKICTIQPTSLVLARLFNHG